MAIDSELKSKDGHLDASSIAGNQFNASETQLTDMYDVLIIGSGPSGLTAAIYTTRFGLKTLVVAGKQWGGQLQLTTRVENFPGFPDGIQGPELMINMRQQAEKLGTKVVDADMDPADFLKQSGGPFTITAGGEAYQGRALLIATGADAKTLGVNGEEKFIGQGLSYCATCDGMFFREKDIIVAGGGDSAMEEAISLTNFAKSVTIIHRRDKFRASQIMIDKAKQNPKIKFLMSSQIVQILGEQELESVEIKTSNPSQILSVSEPIKKAGSAKIKVKIVSKTKNETVFRMPIDGIFVAIGHTPNSAIFKGLSISEQGYVQRLERMRTNIDGIFVAGNVSDDHYQQAITAAGFGAMAAIDIKEWFLK